MTELDAARISTASVDHQHGDGWGWYDTGNGTVRWGRAIKPHVAEDTARATVLVWGIAAVVAAVVVAVVWWLA